MNIIIAISGCFNTQPPEGGWVPAILTKARRLKFQHTAARRRLVRPWSGCNTRCRVSTHSRPKAAGYSTNTSLTHSSCFNTQPPEGGWAEQNYPSAYECEVSTHSRPKAAGPTGETTEIIKNGFNTQPPEGGWQRHDAACRSR